ncbi:MAG TPA: TetR family transcriptional regulator [Actinocatenispora sp.]
MSTGTVDDRQRPGTRDEQPRPRDREATEQRILAEAARLFAEQGYRTVTVRAIAAAADVNLALINRYYGSKLGLFDAVLSAGQELPQLTDVPLDDLPRYLAEYAMRQRNRGRSHGVSAATRSAESPEVRDLLQKRLENLLIAPLAQRLPAEDARARAALCVAVLIGTGYVRRILAADAPPSPEFVDRLTEVFRTCLS